MKELALIGLSKLLNKEVLTEEELESVKMYFIVVFANSSARYTFSSATPENANQLFEEAIKEDLNHIFANRYGQ